MWAPFVSQITMNRTKLIAIIAIVAIVVIALRRRGSDEEYEGVDRID